MRLRPSCLIVLLLTLVLAVGPAKADDWKACTTLSFAPLDHNIPACDRVLESDALSDDRRVQGLLARAEAFLFARTYHHGHTVDTSQLLRRALADLNQAETVARRSPVTDLRQRGHILSERGSVLYQLGLFQQAVHDYTAALQMSGTTDTSLLLARALAYKEMGRFEDAIADMNEVVRVSGGAGNQSNWIYLRGQVHEAAGNREAAIADYRQAVKLDGGHVGAIEALKRLGNY